MTDLEQRIRQAYEQAPTDLDILGDAIQPGDETSETLQGKVTYAWYYAIAAVVCPDIVAEMGVRYGYSSLALLWRGQFTDEPIQYFGWDAQNYGVQSNAIARKNLGGLCDPLFLSDANTQFIRDLGIRNVDLFSVDGDHSEAGAYHDMQLAFEATRNGGLLLVDDVTEPGLPDVRRAFDRFVKERGLEWFILPTYRGLGVITVKK